MTNWQPLVDRRQLPSLGRYLCEVDDRRLAVFDLGDRLVAIDNHCPHRGGPVAAGPCQDDVITCPWHGLEFHLRSGHCLSPGAAALKMLPVEQRDQMIFVDLDPPAEPDDGEPDDGIHRYLIRYGTPGHVGRFGTVEELACRRGDPVIVHTPRGVEWGQVLRTPAEHPRDERPPAGELLRQATSEDQRQRPGSATADQALQRCQQLIAGDQVPVVAVDAEVLFDGQTVIVYYLGPPTERLGPIAVQAATEATYRIQFEPLEDAELQPLDDSPASETARRRKQKMIKGPYERLKYDLRRVWECPVCKHRERTSGNVTTMVCRCQEKEEPTKRIFMKLVEDGVRKT